MTGYGEARHQQPGLAVAVEVRSVNSRYFKLTFRSGDGYGALEPEVEAVVRRYIKRGTVQVALRIDRDPSPDDYRICDDVFMSYRRQLKSLYDRMHVSESIHLEAILALPGVIDERATQNVDHRSEWPVVEKTLEEAMDQLSHMRRAEGQAMAEELTANGRAIQRNLDEIHQRYPQVVDAYRQRLTDRLNKLLAGYDVNVEPADVVREVGLFAERTDIAEEIVRLRSHLSQFEAMMETPEAPGRKLDFLIQEMFREANTIGSKANDAEIARRVVEIKTAIDRMREMVQNVE
jgi:uncharacterized protein (TIGR00255 family)